MGRRIFDNIKKAISYIFAIHIPIAGISLIPVLLNWPLIFYPVHIVFLELIIDPACTIIFEAEKEEKNLMSNPPRKTNVTFYGMNKIGLSCLQGLAILITTLLIYFIGLHFDYNQNEVRTMTFVTLIVSNLAIIQTNRSWTNNIFKIIATPNKAVLWVIGGAISFLILILNVPFFLDLFQFQHLSLVNIGICTIAGISTILWFELYKLKLNSKKLKKI